MKLKIRRLRVMAEYRKLPIPNYDIETAALENDEEAVRAYTNQVSKYMIELYRSMQYVTLEGVLEKELLNSTYCIEKVEKESPVQFFIGFYAGILRMIKVAVKENYKQLNIQECLKELEWENIPHMAQILETIYKTPRIQHRKLARDINISPGTLTGLMDRMTADGLVTFIRSGKYKYYILTPAGLNYYERNQPILERATEFQDKISAQYQNVKLHSSYLREINNSSLNAPITRGKDGNLYEDDEKETSFNKRLSQYISIELAN